MLTSKIAFAHTEAQRTPSNNKQQGNKNAATNKEWVQEHAAFIRYIRTGSDDPAYGDEKEMENNPTGTTPGELATLAVLPFYLIFALLRLDWPV